MRFRYKLTLSLALSLFLIAIQSVYQQVQLQILRSRRNRQELRYYTPPTGSIPAQREDVTSQHKGLAVSATVNYSSSGDEIRVGASFIQLKGDWYDGLILMPSFTISGNRLKPPQTVRFKFISYFTDQPFQSMTNLKFMADGKLVFDGPMQIESRSDATQYNSTSSEVAEVEIPYRSFERLCKAKRIDLSAGGAKMSAPDEALSKLRDMKKQVDLGSYVN